MKIIGICGSPRKKNTYFMVEAVLNSAKEKGAETEFVHLADLDIKHCTGCVACEKTGECVINDDMKSLLEKITNADALVLGSPSYYNNVTGLMKDFIDRTNPTWKEMKLKGKKAGVCCTGSEGLAVVKKCTDILVDFAETAGIEVVGSVTANDKSLDAQAVVDELKKLGEEIAVS